MHVTKKFTHYKDMHTGSCYPNEWDMFKVSRKSSGVWAGGYVKEVCPVTGKYCIVWYSWGSKIPRLLVRTAVDAVSVPIFALLGVIIGFTYDVTLACALIVCAILSLIRMSYTMVLIDAITHVENHTTKQLR